MVFKFKECSGTERYKASPSEFTIRFNDVPKYRHSFPVDHKKHTRIIITHQAQKTRSYLKLSSFLFIRIFFPFPRFIIRASQSHKMRSKHPKKNIPNLFSPKTSNTYDQIKECMRFKKKNQPK